MSVYSEDNLVQKTTADYLKDNLGWDESVFAMEETFGPAGTLGRANDSEVVLTRYLVAALRKFNPGFADEVYVAGGAESSSPCGRGGICKRDSAGVHGAEERPPGHRARLSG